MRTDDLKILFKNAAFKPEDIKSYIIDLLNKFEVALMWDEHQLLIPSLLPTEDHVKRGMPASDIRVSISAWADIVGGTQSAYVSFYSTILLQLHSFLNFDSLTRKI